MKLDLRGSEEVRDSRDPEGTEVTWDHLDEQESRWVLTLSFSETKEGLGQQ